MNLETTDLGCAFEAKEASNKAATFRGVASTDDLDDQGDIIEPGAFLPIALKSSGAPDVLLLRDHDRTNVIGGWTRIEQAGRELQVEGELCLSVAKARETYQLMKRGFISGLSVGFFPARDGVRFDDKAGRRYIRKASLRECSIVAMPANGRARVTSVKTSAVADWLKANGCTAAEIDRALAGGLDAIRTKQNGNGNGNGDGEPPDVRSGESRDAYMSRCLRATGGDMAACRSAWDDYEEDDEEDKAFAEHLEPRDKWTCKRLKESDPEKPWGDVAYADPGYQDDGVKRYPLDVESRIRSAWNYIHQSRNAAKYTAEQLKRIIGKIIAAWKRKIDPDGPPGADDDKASRIDLDRVEDALEGVIGQMRRTLSHG